MNNPLHKARRPCVIGASSLVALLIICGLSAGAAAASDTGKPAANTDGFTTLLAAHDEKGGRPGDVEPLPQTNAIAKLRTPTMVNAPMWSVVRAYYGPDGELVWGCTIEHRPLIEQPGNQIPD
jgi:hypothetical protein